jgi:hypothetical protein
MESSEMMMTAGVAIDTWKIAIFKRHLDGAGYTYTEHPFSKDTMILKVKTASLSELEKVVEAAHKECKTQ